MRQSFPLICMRFFGDKDQSYGFSGYLEWGTLQIFFSQMSLNECWFFSLLFLPIVFRCYFHINCVTNIDYGHSKPKLIASIQGKWSSNLCFFIWFFYFHSRARQRQFTHTQTNIYGCHLNSSECKRWQHWLLWSEPKTATMARIVLEIRKTHKKINRHPSIRKKNGSHCNTFKIFSLAFFHFLWTLYFRSL